MRIGMVGSGRIGLALTRHLARHGHSVAMANSRGPETLGEVIAELDRGVRATDVHDAVQASDVVFVAVPYRAVPATAKEGDPWDGKVVVDVTNFYPPRDAGALDPRPDPSSRVVARLLENAIVVKAFNTMRSARLTEEARPAGTRERLAIPVAADDEVAKQLVMALVDECGFDPVDAGSLADSWRQEPGTPVSDQRLGAAQVRDALAAAVPPPG